MHSERVVRVTVLSMAPMAVMAFGVAFVLPTSPIAVVAGDQDYLGARIMPPGPAAKGLPLVPVRIDAQGFLEGVPTHLGWYEYCQPTAPGLSSEFVGSNRFSYYLSPQQLQQAEMQMGGVWYGESIGENVRPENFTELWQGATVIWRTPTEDGQGDQLAVILVKVDPSMYSEDIRDEFMPDGFAAFHAADAHFCCVAGYQVNNSPRAKDDAGRDYIFDSCHDSRYDVRDIRRYTVPANGD